MAEKPSSDAAHRPAPLVGTDVLGRPLTADERKHWAGTLRQHDFNGARRYALLFGRRLTRNPTRAEDVVSRACLRLVRWGWDPRRGPARQAGSTAPTEGRPGSTCSRRCRARATATGLTAGTTVQFRYRSVIKGGAADWSPPISLLVH